VITDCDICIPNKNFFKEYDVSNYPIKVKKDAVKQECKVNYKSNFENINSISKFFFLKKFFFSFI